MNNKLSKRELFKYLGDMSQICGVKDYILRGGKKEQSFYHTLRSGGNGETGAAIINPGLKLGVSVKYNVNQPKLLAQVKLTKENVYMATIEPLNCGVEGRAEERRLGRLEYIKPGETRAFNVSIEILNGEEEIESFERYAISL